MWVSQRECLRGVLLKDRVEDDMFVNVKVGEGGKVQIVHRVRECQREDVHIMELQQSVEEEEEQGQVRGVDTPADEHKQGTVRVQ